MPSSMVKRLLCGFLCVALPACGVLPAASAHEAEARRGPPAGAGDDWETASAEASGFDAARLASAFAATDGANVHGILVERHGRLVAERYGRGRDYSIDSLFGLWRPFAEAVEFGPASRHDVRSISKSVVGLLVGLARQRGEITSLATPVLDYYPECADLRSPEREAITLEHLLTMSSGLQWDEEALPNDETRLYWDGTPYRSVLGRPMVAKPGEAFHYNSGGVAVLADVLLRATGKPLEVLARTELLGPLGITDWEWISDLHGRNLAFVGLRMRPRDLAKIGRMLLAKGQWHGQQIVPAAWVAESLRPRLSTGLKVPPSAPHELQYGYLWWSGTTDWQGKHVAWSAGFGNGGQRLFVVPELDLVVVVTTGAYGSPAIAGTIQQLFDQVIAAIQV